MEIRLAKKNDLNKIVNIINQAKLSLKEQGINQWQRNYPNANIIGKDINSNSCYVLEENGKLFASFAISFNGDIDYDNIYEGNWKKDDKYSVVHRVAITKEHCGKGLASKLLNFAQNISKQKNINYMKIDTHNDNLKMRKVLTNNNFELRGLIDIADGSSRIVFDKVF